MNEDQVELMCILGIHVCEGNYDQLVRSLTANPKSQVQSSTGQRLELLFGNFSLFKNIKIFYGRMILIVYINALVHVGHIYMPYTHAHTFTKRT